MNTLPVAAIQLTSTKDWRDNLLQVKQLVDSAVKEGAKLIVLPENVFLFYGKGMRALAQSDEQDILLTEISELAKEYEIYLVVGSHPELLRPDGSVVANGRVRQTCWVIGPDGVFLERYDKIHLFDVMVDDKAASYKESDFIEAGELALKVIDIEGFKVGLSICYDLRFPELYRELGKLGADILLVPSAFTYVTGKAHWNTLLSARAIENQCYVLGVDQCGWHNETRQTFGHSVLYSPFGRELVGLLEEPGYFVFTITKQMLADCRQKMPCLTHRRM
ncbi:carbon-nitrogen hydrolase family protein [Marinomonas sp. CT5]|uniref:carbon-nitrogen hydrolase family protein n=1 Tax=Marinomonas sp. CT5 TaxID=2066133 RepID=UPI0017BCC12D|nr:carbon-nitrogen hydrolase family protein [Marinomonas sp. CT5]NVK75798.1 carbon-nitrogen hydrolase family protein [Oceanospirillaceae bacterium]QUX96095.1 carbon-nitrogen hydrolase family protein [Marinomonas sp. CT5]